MSMTATDDCASGPFIALQSQSVPVVLPTWGQIQTAISPKGRKGHDVSDVPYPAMSDVPFLTGLVFPAAVLGAALCVSVRTDMWRDHSVPRSVRGSKGRQLRQDVMDTYRA